MTKLKSIKPSKSKFGLSFGGKSGPTKFYEIFRDKEYAGEVEFAITKNEILSIYIDPSFRGKGVGKDAVNQLFDIFNINEITAWAAKSSIPFWKKISTKRLDNDIFIIKKLK